ncbi:MAG: T9SS type A sorting domain-containing protein [Candidatus Marinimicrobia bacterium]|nr:T9SS type A sorting domain-containing protein [Candidatus Neomarinimicrobiota bacterium]
MNKCKKLMVSRLMAVVTLTFILTISVSAESLKVAVIRVAFQTDVSPATTGDGSFVLEDTSGLNCSDWSLDPPPHNRIYFEDHLLAADNYWQRVSDGHVNIDLANSTVFPQGENDSYLLPHDMLFYHPYLTDFNETAKLFELSRDAIALADNDIDFSIYTTIILVHAGMGGDFAFALDPTPGNIPSAYLAQSDFIEYGALTTDEGDLDDLIIIPESQNFLQYRETRSLFAEAEDPCFYQVALNGTIALMLGFHLELPPLYNTETGRSLVGGFALMDQGSNNFHGVVPAYPDPYTRIKKGWVNAEPKYVGDDVVLNQNDAPIRVSISENEYFLIENRQRNLHEPSDMIQWIDGPGFDTVSVTLSAGGVVLRVDEQNAGLPGNGLNIWHVDETAWFSDENPNGGAIQLVDFEEADGAQDMGFQTQLLFADYLETGWWFDPWFAGNAGWFHLNRHQDVIGDSLLNFSSTTFPSTQANDGTPSHLRIENISDNGLSMSFSVASDRMLNLNNPGAIIGWGDASQTLWTLNSDSSELIELHFFNGAISYVTNLLVTPDQIFEGSIDSVLNYRYPWIITNLANGTRFRNIETGSSRNFWSIVAPYEISVAGTRVSFFATQDNSEVLVKWDSHSGTSTSEVLVSPRAKFTTTAGTQIYIGDPNSKPAPVGLTHSDHIELRGDPPDELDVITWSSSAEALRINHLPGSEQDDLEVQRPDHIVPLDVDTDGSYEIALFYQNSVKIINQAGVAWNGSPFSVEAYRGNPLITPLIGNGATIFLRHQASYSIYTLDGQLLDSGVLPTMDYSVENSTGINQEGIVYILSGDDLLFVKPEEIQENSQFWTDPYGRQQGDRIVVLSGSPVTDPPVMKRESVYNYPNPVKGSSTTIRAWIGAVDNWTIEIFSLSGSQISYVDLDVKQQNSYNEWVWDASAASNGVFLAQISAGDQAEIIKIAIIR